MCIRDRDELVLVPDLDTFTIFPWRPQRGRVARFICDVRHTDGTPFMGDSRYILKQVIEEAAKDGYTLNVGPESEFFLFDMSEDGQPTTNTSEKGGFFDIGPVDAGENARRDIVLSLSEMGFEMESSYPSNEVCQHHIDFKFEDVYKRQDFRECRAKRSSSLCHLIRLWCLCRKPISGTGYHQTPD